VNAPPHEFPPEAEPQKPKAYPVTWVSDAVLKLDAQPVLKGLIEQGSFVVVYGPSGSGKSFFTADIAQHIATGQAWRGRKCPQGLVVYVASEAGSSILKRFIGWRDARTDGKRLPLAVLTRGPNLLEVADVAQLCEQLVALQDESGMNISLVVFDTLSRSIPGGDENSAEDMTMAVLAADMLRDRFKCATAYVHHSGKDPDKGARGHSALFAAADLVLRVHDGAATVDKVRDGVSGERFPFTLEPIQIGLDSDSEPVMTCLLNAADHSRPSTKPDPTGKNQRVVLKELRLLVNDKGESMPGTSTIPKGVRAVSYQDLVERMLPKLPDMKAFTARQRISQSVVSLQSTSHVGVQGDYIWLI
jgi:energy-coupling factor transporter ATP-binding protein EcfA2